MSLKRTADSFNSTNGDVLVSGTEYEMATAGSVVAWPRSDRQVLLQEIRGQIVKYDVNREHRLLHVGDRKSCFAGTESRIPAVVSEWRGTVPSMT